MVTHTVTLRDLVPWLARQKVDVSAMRDEKVTRMIAQILVSEAKGNFDRGQAPDGSQWRPLAFPRPNSKGGDKPLRDRGLLMASVSARGAAGHVENVTGDIAEVGTSLDYARIHQDGGVITPKRGKYLAIPVTKEAARAGSPRKFKGDLRFVPSKRKGKGTLRDAAGVIHYALVNRVVVPARPFLGLNERTLTKVETVLAEHLMAQLGGGR